MKATHDIDALIGKFFAGEASPEEAMFLEDWKAKSQENNAYFEACAQILGYGTDVSADAAWDKVKPILKPETKVRKLYFSPPFKVAAAIAAIIVSGLVIFNLDKNDTPQLFAAGNTPKDIRLDDGTGITVASNSAVELDKDYGKKNRSLTLKGSGYFTVKHDEQLPFIIHTGPIHIKDLGTKFDVKTVKDTIYIRVDEGEVLIYDNRGTRITLKAGENAHYVISTQTLEIAVEKTGKPDAAKVFLFNNRKLNDVTAALEAAYNINIRLENPAAGNCLITTEFNDEDVDVALSVIAETLGMTVEKAGDTYILKGAACVQ